MYQVFQSLKIIRIGEHVLSKGFAIDQSVAPQYVLAEPRHQLGSNRGLIENLMSKDIGIDNHTTEPLHTRRNGALPCTYSARQSDDRRLLH
jgi:hypothetical protein